MNQILRDPRRGPGRDVGDGLVHRQLLPVRRGERGEARGAEGHLEAALLPAGAGAGGERRQLNLEMLLQRQLGLDRGGLLLLRPGSGRRHKAGVAGAGGALPAALRLGGDGRLVALHVVAEVARVAEEHLLLHTARYRTAALSRLVTVATHVVPGLVADEAGLAVDALPRLGVDLVRQVLGVVEAAGVDCGERTVSNCTRSIHYTPTCGAAVLARDQLLVLHVALVAVEARVRVGVGLLVHGLALPRPPAPPHRGGPLRPLVLAAGGGGRAHAALLRCSLRRIVVRRVENLSCALKNI